MRPNVRAPPTGWRRPRPQATPRLSRLNKRRKFFCKMSFIAGGLSVKGWKCSRRAWIMECRTAALIFAHQESRVQRGKIGRLTKFLKWNYASVNLNIGFSWFNCNSPHFCLWSVMFLSLINNAARVPSKFILHAVIEHEPSSVTIKLIINRSDRK